MVINGALIEGVDFVGKTTVAAIIVDILTEKKVAVQLNKCYINRSRFVEYFEKQAKTFDTMIDRDYCYTAAILSDICSYKNTNHDVFIIQDRHWFTQVGRNNFFYEKGAILENTLLEKIHIPFKYNFLLTSSYETKVERSRSREAISPRDKYLAEHTEIYQEYEEYLLQLVPKDENWKIIDTTDLSPKQVASEILDSIRPGI